LAFAVLLALAYRSAVVFWPRVQRASDDSASRTWAALLASPLPEDALLVSNDRDEMAPFWYLKYVEGKAGGVDALFPFLQPGPEWSDVVAVTDAALTSGRPVYLVKPMPGLNIRYELDPAAAQPWQDRGFASILGPPVRVLGNVASRPPEHEVTSTFGDQLQLIGYDLAPERPAPGVPQKVTLHWRPLRQVENDYVISVQLVGPSAVKAGQSDQWPGGRYYPMPAWRVGEVVLDAHVLNIAPDAAAGGYDLLVAAYEWGSDPLVHLGEPQVIGRVEIGP
jgi:hypothetical protein